MKHTYGLPYKGSKTKLADRIIDLLPKADTLVDLFCGGCAVAHCALLRNKYKHIHINDINPMMPQAFIKALNGGFDKEDRWISREDFFQLKDTDPYVAICFSFGNNLEDYAYNREIEPKKKALHYAIFFDDFTQADEEFGVDLRPISGLQDRQERYLLAKRLLRFTPPEKYTSSIYSVSKDCRLQNLERLERMDVSKKNFARFDLQNAERLQRISIAKLAEPQPPHFTPPEILTARTVRSHGAQRTIKTWRYPKTA